MFKYLVEIKKRVGYLFICWLCVIINCYFYKETLLVLFLKLNTANLNYLFYYFICTDIFEIFFVYLNFFFFISFQIVIIFSIYHIFIFCSYGLFIFEYNYTKNLFKLIIITWFFSIFISKYFLIPTTFKFFFYFYQSSFLPLYFEAKLCEYLDFYVTIYYFTFLYFQSFILLVFFLIHNNNFGASKSKKMRKLYYFSFIFFSTLITPPDLSSQFVISFFLIIFYELFSIYTIFKNVFLIK